MLDGSNYIDKIPIYLKTNKYLSHKTKRDLTLHLIPSKNYEDACINFHLEMALFTCHFHTCINERK